MSMRTGQFFLDGNEISLDELLQGDVPLVIEYVYA